MKIYVTVAIIMCSLFPGYSRTPQDSTATARIIDDLHVGTIGTTQVKLVRDLSAAHFTSPETLPDEIRLSFDAFLERTLKEPAPIGPIEKGNNGLSVFTIALRFSKDVQPRVIEALVLRTDMPVAFRSNTLDKLRRDKLYNSLVRVGDILKNSSTPADRALAVHSYLNIGRLTPDQATYLLKELESGNSEAKVRLSLPSEVKKIYEALDDTGRQKIDLLITQGKITIPPDRLAQLKKIKESK